MRPSAALIAALIAVAIFPLAAAASDVPLIPAHADWRYLDTGANEATFWREPSYDDSWWDTGPAELGYGDGSERTVVASGPPGNFHVTTYFRRSFDVYDPSVFTDLTVRLLRDDGAVVYLNGTEVWRSNMPASGAIHYQTRASTSVGGPDEETFFSKSIDENLLVAGTNVVAVEIHQVDSFSSDISFNLELIGTSSVPIVVLTRGPYLQQGTPESVRIRWRTNSASDSRVRYGTSPGNLNLVVDDNNTTTEHDVLLSGLSPSTRYYYSVGTSTLTLAGDASHRFYTSPYTGSTDPMRIWVLGDSGTADYNASTVRDAYLAYTGSTRTNLWLMLGDNAYDVGLDSEYQAAVFEMYPQMLKQSVLWPTIGNHDTAQSQNPPSNLPYFNIFTLPASGEAGGAASGTEKYYSFDYGNIHFVCLDSMTSNRSSSGPMLTWLRNDLEATSQQWVVAFWHHPPYSKGSHDSDSDIFLREMRQNAVPILEEYGVDLVMSGHSHSYERSFLIDSHYGTSNTLVSSMKKDGGDGRVDGTGAYTKGSLGMAPNLGAVYVVAGSSGQITAAPLNHPAMYIGLANLGSLVLDVNAGRMDVKFLRENGVTADWFTIVKEAPCEYALSPSSFSFSAAAADSSLTVTTTEPCTWSTMTSTPWITITGGASGTGSGTTTFTVAANDGAARSGSITLGELVVPVTQACQPPAISAQPQPVTIVAGESATLSVTATGAAPLSYEWYANSTLVNGANGPSLTVTPSSTTTYRARVISACGSLDSAEATVTVQPCSYSVSPQSFEFAAAGGDGNYTITTTGTCSWTASTDTPWITLTGGTNGSGNAMTTFTVAANDDASRSGSITVAGIVIPVTQGCTLPAIAQQPQSGTITVGESKTLQVAATSPSALSYQWYAGTTLVEGAVEPSLTVTPSSTTTYTVRVTNACGPVDSAEATVTVNPCTYEVTPTSFDFEAAFDTGLVTVVAPNVCSWTATTTTPWIAVTQNASGSGDDVVVFDVEQNSGVARSGSVTVAGVVIPVTQACKPTSITQQPESRTIYAGGSAELSVIASGPVPLSYQWFAGSTPIEGATGSSLTVTPSSTTTYKVQVTSACAAVDSNEATVTVQPCTYGVSPSSFSFTSAASNGSIAVTTPSTCSWTATTSTPWITLTGGLSGTGGGTTTFTVASNGGDARSGSITVAGTVIPVTQAAPPCEPAAIATQPQPATVVAGGSATLTVTAGGTAPLAYQWYTGLSGDTASPVDGATTSSLTVTPAADTRYWVRVTNACGSVDSTAALVTVAPCTYSISPASFSFDASGGGGTITVDAAGSTCGWSAASNAAWITVTEGLNGNGDGQTTFTVAANGGPEPRNSSIAIAGEIIPIAQSEPVAAGAPPAPSGVNARLTLPGRITVSWDVVPGATGYQVDRRSAGGGGFVTVGSTTTNKFFDYVTGGEAYLYRVRALNGAIPGPVSANDLATAVVFTNDPLTASQPIRAIHLAELRDAVNAVRRLAGLANASYTGAAVAGTVIAAVHITELRAAFDQARILLGIPAAAYGEAVNPLVRVKAAHFTELRTRVR